MRRSPGAGRGGWWWHAPAARAFAAPLCTPDTPSLARVPPLTDYFGFD
jgi:hypothetical protein